MKHTGNTPDGRRKGEPFGPGANLTLVDSHEGWRHLVGPNAIPGLLDGISYTVSVARRRRTSYKELIDANVKAIDMYFEQGGFHMNLNVIDKEVLEDAMKIRTSIRNSQSAYPDMPSTSCA
jgi:formate C-acetyltransferase